MAGIESFQQSGLKTSLPNVRIREKNIRGNAVLGVRVPYDVSVRGALRSMRLNAMAREMEPLSNSLSRTAVAAEYVPDGGVETRE